MTKSPTYFVMMRGLRGCYMPDDVAHYKADNYKEFCSLIRYEIEFNEAKSTGQIPFAWKHLHNGDWREVCVATSRDSDGYGILVSRCTEQEFNEAEEANQ